jgi:hypothetical protein
MKCPRPPRLRAGVVAVIGIFGLAWLGDSFIAAHKDVIVPAIGDWAKVAPWTFAFGLFLASVLLYSQAATTRALMPLGIALGIPPQFLIAMFPSVNGYFFIPTYGSLIAAINFDLSGTTKIGKYVLNHSFMIPGLVATSVAVFTGLAIARDDLLRSMALNGGWCFCQGQRPLTSSSSAKLSSVRMATMTASTPRFCSVGSIATVPMMSAITRNSSPSRMARPRSARSAW